MKTLIHKDGMFSPAANTSSQFLNYSVITNHFKALRDIVTYNGFILFSGKLIL